MLAHQALRIVPIDCNDSVVTGYKLFARLAGLYRQRKFQGEDLELKRACPNRYPQKRRLCGRACTRRAASRTPRHALPSQSRIIPARVHRRRWPCERSEGAFVPDLQPRDGAARRQSPAPGERLRDDPETLNEVGRVTF